MAQLQAVDKTRLFGMGNQFLIGASYDHGDVDYSANSELGFFGPKFVVNSFATPFFLEEPDDVRAAQDRNEQRLRWHLCFQHDRFDEGLRAHLGRPLELREYRAPQPESRPDEEDKLTGTHKYYRFNPMAGATYNLLPGLTLYGGYSEANRAPTAAELACADPEAPCLIESFLTADPPLKQVVSHTFELGLRGKLASWNSGQLQWTAGLFRTENTDDIIAVSSPINGRGFFLNAGDTLRQGVEAGVTVHGPPVVRLRQLRLRRCDVRDAPTYSRRPTITRGAAFECLDPSNPNPDADEPLCIQVNPGDQLPGVPRHRFKAGVDYWVTSAWKVGADVVAASDQVFFGDEGNDGTPLDGYAKVDIRTVLQHHRARSDLRHGR